MTEAQNAQSVEVAHMWPPSASAAEELPDRARQFLNQALASIHAPAGAVMLTASAIDAMLKDRA